MDADVLHRRSLTYAPVAPAASEALSGNNPKPVGGCLPLAIPFHRHFDHLLALGQRRERQVCDDEPELQGVVKPFGERDG